MDYAVVTSLLGIVEQQLLLQQPHPCLILRADTEIILSSLRDKLCFLQSNLRKPEPKPQPEAHKHLHQGIRDVVAEAEDKIESKLREVCLAADKGEHAAAAVAVEDLHKTLQQVVKDFELQVEVYIRDLQITQPSASLQLENISDGDDLEPPRENVMIGLNDEFEKIRKMLINWRSERREVISIVGKGGVGKTTLAQTLYRDPSIMNHFQTRAWSTVPQEFSVRNILIDLLGCIDSIPSRSRISTYDLAHRLYKILNRQRYLIVIDNVWALDEWDHIIYGYFPDDLNGSRILMTTRIMKVAEYASSRIVEVGQDLRRMALEADNTMIGLKDEFEEIRTVVLAASTALGLEVISIVGMKGSGKTTLAQTVYGDTLVGSHFDIRSWVTISQEFSVREVVISILHNCAMFTSDFSKGDTNYLADLLYRSLKNQRYLVVIDDVQAQDVWDEIRSYFPNDSIGSRILITTPSVQVARNASSSNEYIYHTRALNPDESWNLFVMKVFNGKSCPQHLLSVGRNIVEKCYGLPLAIVMIAGLLSQQDMLPKQWEDFAKNTYPSFMDLVHHSDSQILHEWSYTNLPIYLRACFLYLGIFPKNSDIHVKKLIMLWVAEGLLKPEMDKSLEEVAEAFLLDLIARNLVLVMKLSFDGKVKSCRLHDSLHDFCLRKAQEERRTLAVINEYPYDLADRVCRWMSCQSRSWPITPSTSLNCGSYGIRSILYFGKDLYLAKCRFKFPCLKLLRVLDLSLIKYWHGMPSEIADLIHLRYLALTTTGSLCNTDLLKLQNLQTLILFSWKKDRRLHLPCEILDLPWLRHVHLDKGSSLHLPNSVRGNLRTIFWLKVSSWDSKTPDFTRVPNLKDLGIYFEGEVTADALDSLFQLHQLEKLKIEMGRVERFNLLFFFPPNIKKLTLCNTYRPWEEAYVISMLPNLVVLKLKDFAFCGPEWGPIDGGFQRLKFLLIAHSDLEHWIASADNFPVLECLVLRCCWYLEQLPSDFPCIFTLRLIELIDCCPSLVDSAMRIRDEMSANGNNGLVVRHSLTEDKSSKEES